MAEDTRPPSQASRPNSETPSPAPATPRLPPDGSSQDEMIYMNADAIEKRHVLKSGDLWDFVKRGKENKYKIFKDEYKVAKLNVIPFLCIFGNSFNTNLKLFKFENFYKQSKSLMKLSALYLLILYINISMSLQYMCTVKTFKFLLQAIDCLPVTGRLIALGSLSKFTLKDTQHIL